MAPRGAETPEYLRKEEDENNAERQAAPQKVTLKAVTAWPKTVWEVGNFNKFLEIVKQKVDKQYPERYLEQYTEQFMQMHTWARLVVEVDGGQHFSDDSIEYDRIRDEFMRSMGLTVLRVTNIDVMDNIEGVIEIIESKIQKLP